MRGACLRCHSAGAHRFLPGLAGFMLRLPRGMKVASFLEAGNLLPFQRITNLCVYADYLHPSSALLPKEC